MLKTILVGFDASDSAERALGRGADLAEALGARLVVTSVAVLPVSMPGIDAALPGAPAQFAAAGVDELELNERHLERARALLAERPVETEFVAEVGAPAERIVELAEEHGADLIVVGTREPGFLARLLQGSVSEDVSRATHRDVMIVH
ncbi:MAG: universal stress protein [Actinobacteria bacterium]|nr:universal stress protein [Actinomycetota bacterium]